MQGRKKNLYKRSPICHFFILLQAGAEADTHKDPFQWGIIYHATEIHKRQIILRSSCFHWPAQGLKPAAIRCHGHRSAGSLNRQQHTLILQKQPRDGGYGYLSWDSVDLVLICGRLVKSAFVNKVLLNFWGIYNLISNSGLKHSWKLTALLLKAQPGRGMEREAGGCAKILALSRILQQALPAAGAEASHCC